MSSLFQTIGTNNPQYLLADPQGADVIAIPCEPGNGALQRGQIMYRKETGFFAPAGGAQVIGTNALVVLDEAVNTDANASIAEDARAYRAGHLIADKLILAGGGALTPAQKLVLRQQNIVLEWMDNAPVFNNEKV